MYEEVKEIIKKNEGLRLSVYKDTRGFPTIGYGHLIKKGEKFGLLTKQQADELFEKDFAEHLNHAKKFPGFAGLTENRRGVIIDMTFNMGANWWNKWPNFVRHMVQGDYNSASNDIRSSRYYKQVGKRAERNIDKILNG